MMSPADGVAPLLIAGGEVVDSSGRRLCDVLVEGGVIREVSEGLAARLTGELPARLAGDLTGEPTNGRPPLRMIDASGCLVAPGLVDLFARLGEPGNEGAETASSATAAASLGGFTTLVAQPDTTPPLDSVEALAQLRQLTADLAVEVIASCAITTGRAGEQLVAMAELADAGLTWFTDVGPLDDLRLLIAALTWSAVLDVTVVVQPTTTSLAAGTALAEGRVSARTGVAGEPAVSEEVAVATALAVHRATGGRLHLDRVSTAAAVELIRAAKRTEQLISASVTADHLVFTDDDCETLDWRLRSTPPYRTPRDREALIEGVADGTIDAVVSGHTPLAVEKTDVPFEQAEPGAIGLQTAAASTLDVAGLSVNAALAALSWRPTALIDPRRVCAVKADAPADLVVIDQRTQWHFDATDVVSGCTNTPHLGRSFGSRVTRTICRGEVVVDEAALSSRSARSKAAPEQRHVR